MIWRGKKYIFHVARCTLYLYRDYRKSMIDAMIDLERISMNNYKKNYYNILIFLIFD